MKRQKRNPNDRALHKGYVAAVQGRDHDSCPYQSGSLHQEWVNGWRQGREDIWSGFGPAAQAQRLESM
ncbi:ribosome modulation factor [Microbulbifer agarilyticus]|uniref:Ribosome modulation factor n=1 Tax=Microbulbifer agarilyticus TaxID=260552 RepID=A0A1Q2M5G2_9GAMM|nr:ribosome modulation factor [Microbulbifer agarilyticus]AQQ67527.1 ribosome modulation factor [Microbulbifer agarilyticus]MBY6189189.1 ribosome modulation factor [Microbulbifer agarilyticus]MBY6212258.1 ribosome modulation factor [Microbulbifer agarilyticus]MCA0893693.1 ribosome modulation factor [Microbulbifer agarilyticus]